MGISVKDGKMFGNLVLNTTLDPITKNRPDGRNIVINGFKINVDNVELIELENKAIKQIGIEVRAKIKNWSAPNVRALNNTSRGWNEWFSQGRGSSIENRSMESISADVKKSKSKEEIANLIADLQKAL